MSSLEARLKRLEQRQVTPTDDYFSQFKGLSFEAFWDAIGKPIKNGVEHGIYPYEQMVYKALQDQKYVWVKKATGLGITEFILRYMAWIALKDNKLAGTQLCIVTGPRIDLAEDLIERMVKLFQQVPKHTKTELFLNGVKIGAFPSHHLDSMRGLPDVKFIFLDEADFFPPGQQDDARHVSERYIAKSDPHIVMVSTPNLPDGLFDRMEKEDPCVYHRMLMPYSMGLGNIYTEEEIGKAKRSPSFEREYNLKYGYGIGNIWLHEAIDACTIKEQPTNKQSTNKSMGIDMAFGREGQYAIIVSQLSDGRVEILEAHETKRTDPIEAANDVIGFIYKYGFAEYDKIYVDASNPGFIKTLKRMLGENSDYQNQMDNLKKQKMDYERVMRVIPVAFGRENDQAMLSHAQQLGANKQLAIWDGFTTLLAHMRSARTENDGTLDKKDDSHDIIDSLFLNLRRYRYRA